jgi:hypothetical protein
MNVETFKMFMDPSIDMNALEYFKQRSHLLVRPFIEIPLRCSAQAMSAEGNTGGYALLRGRFWSFTLCKLYCIIGRAPTHYH